MTFDRGRWHRATLDARERRDHRLRCYGCGEPHESKDLDEELMCPECRGEAGEDQVQGNDPIDDDEAEAA